jgi:hypothetical protein
VEDRRHRGSHCSRDLTAAVLHHVPEDPGMESAHEVGVSFPDSLGESTNGKSEYCV